MKTIKFFNLLLLILITSPLLSQQVYISPVPGSKFHNPETSIILKFDSQIELSSLKSNNFSIIGTKNKNSQISIETSTDKKTIILKNNSKFDYGETITVKINDEIKLATGKQINIPEFSFTIKDSESELASSDNELSNITKTHNNENFPPITINVNDNPAEGKIFFHNLSAFASDDDRFYAIIENDGTPFFAQQDDKRGLGFTLQKNGYLTFWNNKNFYMLDSSYAVVDSFACGNGYIADWHELQVLENGHAFLIAYDVQTISTGILEDSIKVEGLIIQEIDENKNVIFQWRIWDHFDMTDYGYTDTSSTKTYFIHGNAIEIDHDGNILASLRAMNQIIKIDRITGDVIWQLGGNNNDYTFINDSCFCEQHDIRRLANGNITLYDNGTCHSPQISKAKEYILDEINKTATLVWEYEHPEKYWASSMGNVQRLDNGNTLINWGQINLNSSKNSKKELDVISKITEVRPDKSIAYELTFEAYFHLVYRAYRFDWDVTPPVVPTNTDLMPNKNKINIYPNPANESFNINIDDSSNYLIEIFNSTGTLIKKIVNIEGNNVLIDTQNFKSGLYYCKVSSGNKSITQKIIILN